MLIHSSGLLFSLICIIAPSRGHLLFNYLHVTS